MRKSAGAMPRECLDYRKRGISYAKVNCDKMW